MNCRITLFLRERNNYEHYCRIPKLNRIILMLRAFLIYRLGYRILNRKQQYSCNIPIVFFVLSICRVLNITFSSMLPLMMFTNKSTKPTSVNIVSLISLEHHQKEWCTNTIHLKSLFKIFYSSRSRGS